MSRLPRASDLYDLRVATDVALSPDGESVAFSVKEVSPTKDGYRQALWMVPADGSAPPRRLTLGANNDTTPRWSPDGRTLAFISDRMAVLIKGGAAPATELDRPADEGARQVWLLDMAGGEARQLTFLPKDVTDLCWSPDSERLCLVSAATDARREPEERRPGDPPARDMHLIDRLQYMLNGEGYVYRDQPNLWLVEVADGRLRRLTSGPGKDVAPAWSPDGRRICFTSNRHRDADLTWRTDIYAVDVDGGKVARITGGRGDREFGHAAWSPDGEWIAAVGHRYQARAGSRSDVWRFRSGGNDEGENLTAESDRDAGAGMNSDLFGFAVTRPRWSADGSTVYFAAPVDGSYELWRVEVAAGRVERITRGEHFISRVDVASLPRGRGQRAAAVLADATNPPDIVSFDIPDGKLSSRGASLRRLSNLMGDAWTEVERVSPVSRWHVVDGRRIQGWFYQAPDRRGKPAPLVVEIHGGPATLYGYSLMWEWQCLVAAGMSVYACNPRGSQGYGQDFTSANFGDWGDGPMRDVMGGVDALIEDGLVDGDRLGVTGGSYGGYLTSWMVGHTDRFKAAASCRAVNDMTAEMLSGDIAGPLFGRYEYGANPWEDPELYREHSPLTYAERIHTPLLIQHAENDLRCPITQAEELFAVLRSLKRPVRFLRVPEENHELTRSGKPFRRVENIERITEWFRHFLVEGKAGLPPIER